MALAPEGMTQREALVMQLTELIEGSHNVDTGERWLSAGLGAALLMLGRRRPRSLGSAALAVTGTALALRALTGYCPAYRIFGLDSRSARASLRRLLLTPPAIRVGKTLTIRRPVEEVYEFCRNQGNLQLVIGPVERFERLADGYQRWYFRAPRGLRFSTDLEITDDHENNELISWRSRATATTPVQGFLSLKRGRDAGETVAHVSLAYEPPLGLLGNLAARGVSPLVDQLVLEALRRLQQVLEAKETPPPAAEAQGARPKDAATKEPPHDHDFEDRFRQTTDGDGRILH
jgi:uncharacterized membrane protein